MLRVRPVVAYCLGRGDRLTNTIDATSTIAAMSLAEAVADPARRPGLVAACVAELEAELDDRSGLSAVALRTAYKAVQKLRPNLVENNLDRLLPQFAPVLDKHATQAGGNTAAHFQANGAAIAEDLVVVTDGYVAGTNNGAAKKVYEKLRPKAVENVLDGMPRLARLVDQHS
jgi:hypothetical protein